MKMRLLLVILTLLAASLALPASAVDYSCQRSPDTFGQEPLWSTSGNEDLKFVVSWAFKDPEKCIVGMQDFSEITGAGWFHWNYGVKFSKDYRFATKWSVTRDGDMTLVSAETEFPIALLLSLPNRNADGYSLDLSQIDQKFEVFAFVKIKKSDGFENAPIRARYGLSQLWGNWFSKNQGLHAADCKPIGPNSAGYVKANYKLSYKVVTPGRNPVVEISIDEPSNCIFLIHSGPLEQVKRLAKTGSGGFLAEHPFWSGEAPTYFDSILKSPNQVVQIGTGNFTGSRYESSPGYRDENILEVISSPRQTLSHIDNVKRQGNRIIVTTTIDGSQINPNENGDIGIYLGFYSWYSKESSYFPGGWRVSFSGNTWTARYLSGTSLPGGIFMSYTTDAIKIPISKLFSSSETKSTTNTSNRKNQSINVDFNDVYYLPGTLYINESNGKSVPNTIFAYSDSRLALEFESLTPAVCGIPIPNYLYLSQPGNCILKISQRGDNEYNPISKNLEFRVSYNKNKTITCIKGKTVKKVSAVTPKCPTGFKPQKVAN